MNLEEERKGLAESICFDSKEGAIALARSLIKQGVQLKYGSKRIVFPPEKPEDPFFVKDKDGIIMSVMQNGRDIGGMGKRTAKNVGEDLATKLGIRSKEDFDRTLKEIEQP